MARRLRGSSALAGRSTTSPRRTRASHCGNDYGRVLRLSRGAATKHLRQLTDDYGEQWGVLIDADEFAVSIDPNFNAVDAQDHAEAQRLFE
ncbi:hypothetical protein [Nocardia sp. R7R-8]|uniref:hypothetical protein n=1 Tax=Nocardia sp. R7R-8 TaxID=3459304 RepID=UPI00403E243E